jgi:hypothetical protein
MNSDEFIDQIEVKRQTHNVYLRYLLKSLASSCLESLVMTVVLLLKRLQH